MANSPSESSLSPAESLEQLAQREAWFRAQAAREFLELNKTLKLQIAENQSLRRVLEERDTAIHRLNLARVEDRTTVEALYKDLEDFTLLLQSSEQSAAKWNDLNSSVSLRLLRPLWFAEKFLARFSTSSHGAGPWSMPPANICYHLYTSPYRIYRAARFTFHGWAVPAEAEKKITAVRVRLDHQVYDGVYGLEDGEAGPYCTPVNPHPGFEVSFATPAGKHQLALELSLGEAGWFSALNIPIWVRPAGANDHTHHPI